MDYSVLIIGGALLAVIVYVLFRRKQSKTGGSGTKPTGTRRK